MAGGQIDSFHQLGERHLSTNDKLYSLGLARGPQSQGLLGIDAFGLPGTVAPGEVPSSSQKQPEVTSLPLLRSSQV